MVKHLLNISIILFVAVSYAQNKQLLYNFDQLPQTLMSNPGAVVNYEYHIGVPLVSGIFLQVGATNKNVTYNNVFAGETTAGGILRNLNDINDLTIKDYFRFNERVEILYGGIRLRNKKNYLSFGMYQEMDGFSLYPEDVVKIYYHGDDRNGDGIPEFDRVTDLNQISMIGNLMGVLHIGISSKINERLNIGARFKLISGSLNVNTTNNKGNYQLGFSETSNLYEHNFGNMDVIFNSSGFLISETGELIGDTGSYLGGLFFLDGNIGMGIDLGFTYQATEKIYVTASLLDMNFINYSNEVTSYVVVNDFLLEDINYFDPPEGGEQQYWKNKIDEYRLEYGDELPLDTLNVRYNTFGSPILNASAAYVMNNKTKGEKSVFRGVKCYKCLSNKDVFTSEIGLQTYTIFWPDKIGWALTGFYSREFNRYINAKITYTYDNFSPYNIGLGVSTHYQRFNFYATLDNLLYLHRLKDSNYQSIQVGFNFIFE
jgi:hypothetical protein